MAGAFEVFRLYLPRVVGATVILACLGLAGNNFLQTRGWKTS